jgi:hypothetical protein
VFAAQCVCVCVCGCVCVCDLHLCIHVSNNERTHTYNTQDSDLGRRLLDDLLCRLGGLVVGECGQLLHDGSQLLLTRLVHLGVVCLRHLECNSFLRI